MIWACQERGTRRSVEDDGGCGGSGKGASGKTENNIDKDSTAGLIRDVQ